MPRADDFTISQRLPPVTVPELAAVIDSLPPTGKRAADSIRSD